MFSFWSFHNKSNQNYTGLYSPTSHFTTIHYKSTHNLRSKLLYANSFAPYKVRSKNLTMWLPPSLKRLFAWLLKTGGLVWCAVAGNSVTDSNPRISLSSWKASVSIWWGWWTLMVFWRADAVAEMIIYIIKINYC